jgi:hypothetical protein
MNKHAFTAEPISPIPPDDLQRKLAVAQPNEDQKLPHIGLVGDTYTILLSGNDTNGRYCLIDMLIPPGTVTISRSRLRFSKAKSKLPSAVRSLSCAPVKP